MAGGFKERRPPFLQSDGLLEVILVWQQASVRHSTAVLRSCPEVPFEEVTHLAVCSHAAVEATRSYVPLQYKLARMKNFLGALRGH